MCFELAACARNAPIGAQPLAAQRIGPFVHTSLRHSGLNDGGGHLPIAATFENGVWTILKRDRKGTGDENENKMKLNGESVNRFERKWKVGRGNEQWVWLFEKWEMGSPKLDQPMEIVEWWNGNLTGRCRGTSCIRWTDWKMKHVILRKRQKTWGNNQIKNKIITIIIIIIKRFNIL